MIADKFLNNPGVIQTHDCSILNQFLAGAKILRGWLEAAIHWDSISYNTNTRRLSRSS